MDRILGLECTVQTPSWLQFFACEIMRWSRRCQTLLGVIVIDDLDVWSCHFVHLPI